MIIFPKRLSQHSREKQYNSGMCSLYVCVMRTTWNIFWAACLLHVLRGIPELLPVQGYACVRKWIRGSLHSLHRHALMLCNQPPFKEAHQLNFLKGLIEMQTSFQRFNEKYCFYWFHVYEGNKLSKKWGVKCFDVEPHAFVCCWVTFLRKCTEMLPDWRLHWPQRRPWELLFRGDQFYSFFFFPVI